MYVTFLNMLIFFSWIWMHNAQGRYSRCITPVTVTVLSYAIILILNVYTYLLIIIAMVLLILE